MKVYLTAPMEDCGYTLRWILNYLQCDPITLTRRSLPKYGQNHRRHINGNDDDSDSDYLHVCWKWFDSTYKYKEDMTTAMINSNQCFDLIVNEEANDISKNKVMDCFETVFGYSLRIDPLTYFRHNDKCVIKNNLNAKHDGFIFTHTTENEMELSAYFKNSAAKGMVFQKLIDNRINRTDNADTLHYRVPPQNKKTTVIKIACDVFTNDEIDNIYAFCNAMHLDYCELDVLRDITNRRIYIVDANDTPTITRNGYSKEEMMKGIEIQAICLYEEIKQELLKKGSF